MVILCMLFYWILAYKMSFQLSFVVQISEPKGITSRFDEGRAGIQGSGLQAD